MITQIKAALEGDARTDNHDVIGRGDAGEGSEPGDVDPFRPSAHVDEGEEHVDMDELFGVLGNERRRYVLEYLSRVEGATTLNDLADHIAAWEYDKTVAAVDSQERKRVYVSLYQCHLPKMDEADALAYDEDRGTVGRGRLYDRFTDHLRHEA